MSRAGAAALVLLLLFLTSQSDWRAARSQHEAAQALPTRLEAHRENIKEKIIIDLKWEMKELNDEKERLTRMVEELQRQLSSCQGGIGPQLDSTERQIRARHGTGTIANKHENLSTHEQLEDAASSMGGREGELSNEGMASSQLLRGHSWMEERGERGGEGESEGGREVGSQEGRGRVRLRQRSSQHRIVRKVRAEVDIEVDGATEGEEATRE